MCRAYIGLVLVSCLIQLQDAATSSQWKRRAIYQLLTDRYARSDGSTSPCQDLSQYCGGTWQGISNKLQYFQDMGFDAVWISPIPDNTDGGYHGYWQRNMEKVNSNFGSEDDLTSLVSTLKQQGIWTMVDVVANHVGYPTGGKDDFDIFYPFNSTIHYHSDCDINDWNDLHQVQFCRLSGLPDLAQENQFVSQYLCNWIQMIVKKYNFDGIRIDTVREVPPWFWSQYSRCSGVYSIGEVDDGDVSIVAPYQGPLDATLNYPLYFTLKQVYQQKQSMTAITDMIKQEKSNFKDTSILGNFLDNHDNPRFLSINKDWNSLKSALAYVIFAEGIPIIYYGTEQAFNGNSDPNNREELWKSGYNQNFDLYNFIGFSISFRKNLTDNFFDAEQIQRYVDDQFYAYSRDDVFVATTNQGSGTQLSRTITYHPYSEGTTLIDIYDNSNQVTVSNGQFDVNIQNGLPVIFVPKDTFDWVNQLHHRFKLQRQKFKKLHHHQTHGHDE